MGRAKKFEAVLDGIWQVDAVSQQFDGDAKVVLINSLTDQRIVLKPDTLKGDGEGDTETLLRFLEEQETVAIVLRRV